MAPDIQLILVVTEQDAEVWLLHGESQLVRLVDQLPGRQQECFPWPDGSDFQTRYCWHPGPPPAGRRFPGASDRRCAWSIRHKKSRNFLDSITQKYACTTPADSMGMVTQLIRGSLAASPLRRRYRFMWIQSQRAWLVMGKLGRPVIGFADPIFFTGLFEVV